jgi:predicted nucleotidyltransferase
MKRNLSRVLKQKLPALKKFFASDPHVLGVWLFGSQTDSTATAQSDIDLAVLFDHDIDLKEEIQFEIAVSNILKTDAVDIVNLNRASLLFRFRAVAGRLLYERDFVRVANFIEQTLIAYRDFEPRAQRALRDFFATL